LSGVTAPFVVRETTADDRGAVLGVVRRAFSDETRNAQEEIDIVEQTWARGRQARPIDLVAVDRDVVGHVLAAAGTVARTQILAVAPLCVAPERHGLGIGSVLMRELLDRATDADWSALVLLGDPEYYGRFGFEPASQFSLYWGPAGPGSPHFLIRRLTDASVPEGAFTYAWEV
jgi:putative acetyltransferase